MVTCTRCGYTGPASGATCPRCGQQLAPAVPLRPTLTLRLEGAGLPSREWEITDTPMGIGRLDDSDISVPDKSVSRQHARILPSAGGFDVEDLGSTNGTWLNDKQVTDRARLSNGDKLVIGDIPLGVMLRSAAPPVVVAQPPPPPPPLPAPPPPPLPSAGVSGGGPSTVFYDIDEALAAAQPSPTPGPSHPTPGPSHPVEVATALDIAPARHPEPPPPVIIDTRPVAPPVVEQATIIAPADPVTSVPPPPPPPISEPRPTPQREAAFEPRPAPRDPDTAVAFDPRPTPQPEPTFEPRPKPQPEPTFEPRPTPQPEPTFEPRPKPQPEPTFEPRPSARPDATLEPRPAPPREVRTAPSEAAADLSARTMVELADQLATALRLLKGDTRLALWLFEHAGGQAAAQTFIQQSARADAHPDDPIEQARLLGMTPIAARLLEAAVMLANVVSTLQSPDDESQADAADLEPITRA